jgi:hypothetical protein
MNILALVFHPHIVHLVGIHTLKEVPLKTHKKLTHVPPKGHFGPTQTAKEFPLSLPLKPYLHFTH